MPKKAKTPIDQTPATDTDALTDAQLEALTAPEGDTDTDTEAQDEAMPSDAPEAGVEADQAPVADDAEQGDKAQSDTDAEASTDTDAGSDSEAPQGAIAEDGQAITPPDAPITEDAPIAEQPSHDDALAQRPLSGHASEEMTGVIDAMPSEAQQHMGQWIKPPEEAEPAEPGQLPTAADLPGTPTDATGIGTQAQEAIASGTQGEAAHADPSDEDVEGEGDAQAEADDDGEAASDTPEGLSEGGQDIELAQAGGADEDADDDSLFGEPLPQHAPLFDVAGETLGEMKTAAEAAHRAAKSLTGFPLEVLDEAHKLLIGDLRGALRDIVRATERLFTRKG